MSIVKLAYMAHPLGGGPDRERNRQLACLWLAALQESFAGRYVVLAPWISLSAVWGEEKRDLGLQVDFDTIAKCSLVMLAGPTNGPCGDDFFRGVSPGMWKEIEFARSAGVEIVDMRNSFSIALPERGGYRPRFERHEEVIVENKPGGVCRVKDVEETARGVYRYLVERTETFFAHEQALGRAPKQIA